MRLIYRAMIEDSFDNKFDLRVEAHPQGLLKIFLVGISRDLSYAGIDSDLLPASVAQGGGTNIAISKAVRASIQGLHDSGKYGHSITSEWIEPEPN